MVRILTSIFWSLLGSYTVNERGQQDSLVKEINVALVKLLTKDRLKQVKSVENTHGFMLDQLKSDLNPVQFHKLEWAFSVLFK